jgi:hypothetical protein
MFGIQIALGNLSMVHKIITLKVNFLSHLTQERRKENTQKFCNHPLLPRGPWKNLLADFNSLFLPNRLTLIDPWVIS